MPHLTPLGTIHTFIAIIAVVAGISSVIRCGRITPSRTSGKVYIVMTVLTCLTGFAIFEHGGFGPPHVLGVITLAVLALAGWARLRRSFLNGWMYVETLSYSLTLFFHAIPGAAETLTRLPVADPLATSQEDPLVVSVTACAFLVFLAGATLQVLYLRSRQRQGLPALL